MASELGTAAAGHHVVSVGGSAEAQFDLIAAAFDTALSRRQRCVFIADRTAPEAVGRALAQRGCDPRAPLASGQLQVLTAEETYTRGGYFDTERMLGVLAASALGAREAGFEGWCGAGEVTWFPRGVPGADRLLEYEYRVNELGELAGAEVICLYDAGATPRWLREELKKVHPLVHGKGRVTRSTTFAAGPAAAAKIPLVEALEPPAERVPCFRLEELLSAVVDGELSGDRARDLAGHVDHCRGCRERLESYRRLKRRLSLLCRPGEVRLGFWEGIRTRLAEVPEPSE